MRLFVVLCAVALGCVGCGNPSPWWESTNEPAGTEDGGLQGPSDAGTSVQEVSALSGCQYIGGLNRFGVRGHSTALDLCAAVLLWDGAAQVDAGLTVPAGLSVVYVGATPGACGSSWAAPAEEASAASGSIESASFSQLDSVDVTITLDGGVVRLKGSDVAITDSCL